MLLVSGGSRGDAQPFLLLGKALQESGCDVLLALPPSYEAEAKTNGLAFKSLRADFDAMLAGQAGQNLKNTGRNPLAVLREGRRAMQDMGRLLVEDVWTLSQDTGASAIIGHIGLSACTQAIAVSQDIPVVHVTLQPFMPTGDFPHPLLPMRVSFGRAYNRLTGNMVKRITWSVFGGEVKRLLEKRLHTRTFTWQDYTAALDKIPIINAFSPAVIPFPADWQPNNHITGFWLPPSESEFQPSETLTPFLDAGSLPVFIGFGSVSDTASIGIALEALQIAGERGVLVGFDVSNVTLPDTVIAASSIPYEWLFPRVKAVVHHGGAGTTALALRAKRPILSRPQRVVAD
jgi:sterol 3beta-glucosyltransferase